MLGWATVGDRARSGTGADLTGADLNRVDGFQLLARDAVLRSVNLFAAHLYSSGLQHADLREAFMNSVRLMGSDLTGADLRGASLYDARLGLATDPTFLTNVRMAGCTLARAAGTVVGPVDIGEATPQLLGGPDLLTWFHDHGATDITLAPDDTPFLESTRR